jgi:hypothetical protein
MTRGQIEALVDTSVSTFIQGTSLYWGHISGRRVEVERAGIRSLRVDIDLAYRVNNWFDPGVDMDFNLNLSCNRGNLRIQPSNFSFHVDSDWYSELLSLGIAQLTDATANGVLNGIAGLFQIALDSSTGTGLTYCPSFFVDGNGDVVFDLP